MGDSINFIDKFCSELSADLPYHGEVWPDAHDPSLHTLLQRLVVTKLHVWCSQHIISWGNLSICPSIYLICLYVCRSMYISVCLYVCLSIYMYVCPSVCLYIYLSLYLPICLFIYLSVYFLPTLAFKTFYYRIRT